MSVERVVCAGFGGNTCRKEPLGRPRCKWKRLKCTLKMWNDGVNWIRSAPDRGKYWADLKTVMNIQGPRIVYTNHMNDSAL